MADVDRTSGARIGVALEPAQRVLELTPGQTTVVAATIANYAPSADTLLLSVEGLPRGWVAPAQPALPIGAGQQLVASLAVTIPAGSEAHAGVYPVTVRAASSARPAEYGEAHASWVIQPFADTQLSVSPRQQHNRKQALFTISVMNLGNLPVRYALSAEDDQQALDISLDQPVVMVEPGRTLHTPLIVRAGGPRWASETHTLTVRAEAAGAPAQVARARFTQTPIVPAWAAAAALLVLLALLCGFGRLPLLAGGLPLYGALAAKASPTATPNTVASNTSLPPEQATVAPPDSQLQATVASIQTVLANAPTIIGIVIDTRRPLRAPIAGGPGDPTQAPGKTELPHTNVELDTPRPRPPATVLVEVTSVATVKVTSVTTVTVVIVPTTAVPPTQTSTPSATTTPTATPSPTTETLPELTIDDVAVRERNSGTVSIIFNVELSQRSSRTVSVDYATADGSARASVDYLADSGTIVFQQNTTFQTITIDVISNTRVDGDRKFYINLSNANGAVLVKSRGTGTIVDDDQEISFDPLPPKKLGDPPFTVSASTSSGLPVSFAAAGGCTISGATVTLVSAGTCTISASQPGSDRFGPAPPVSQSFAIEP